MSQRERERERERKSESKREIERQRQREIVQAILFLNRQDQNEKSAKY